jgi:hypothetical protein
MAFKIQRVDYYYVSVEDRPGEAYKLLSMMADVGVNLLAFNAVPVGPLRTQLSLFPEDSRILAEEARKAGITLDGPYPALLVQGDDELGALAGIHEKLYQSNVNVFASNCVTDGCGSYGYIIYVRPEEFKSATEALKVL